MADFQDARWWLAPGSTLRRRFIVRLDGRYQIPKEWEPLRMLAVEQVADGNGANTHPVYICLCAEVEVDA